MPRADRILEKVIRGLSDNNVDFNDLCRMLEKLGFMSRTKGSHHIFYRSDIDEIINLQPLGSLAKAYQVKQVRNIILKYRLREGDDE